MFNIFVILININKNKEHLTPDGFMLSLAYINILNNKIKQNVLNEITEIHGPLPNLILPPVSTVINLNIPNSWWIIGFFFFFFEEGGKFLYFFQKKAYYLFRINKIRLYFSFWSVTKNKRYLSFGGYKILF
jgi:hypothetical protein